jgi:hypothetical protein
MYRTPKVRKRPFRVVRRFREFNDAFLRGMRRGQSKAEESAILSAKPPDIKVIMSFENARTR